MSLEYSQSIFNNNKDYFDISTSNLSAFNLSVISLSFVSIAHYLAAFLLTYSIISFLSISPNSISSCNFKFSISGCFLMPHSSKSLFQKIYGFFTKASIDSNSISHNFFLNSSMSFLISSATISAGSSSSNLDINRVVSL